MKKVLVTGAAGFLGQALVSHLKNVGHEIYVIGHGTTDCFGHDPSIHRVGEEIELKNLQALTCTLDVAYHFAGTSSVPVAQNDPAMDRIKSFDSTAILIQYLEQTSPSCCLVYSSSAAVYGQSNGALKEESELRPISVYGSTKVACEALIQQSTLGSVIMRFFSIYGAGLRKQLFWDACHKITRGDFHFFGAANAYRDWIHVMDAVRLLELAVSAHAPKQKQIYNGANGQPMAVSAALQMLIHGLGKTEAPIFDRGEKVGDPLGQCGDVSKISKLGYRPSVSLEEGLKDYGAWFLSNSLGI